MIKPYTTFDNSSLKTGMILSETSNAFTKAGVDMTRFVNSNVQQQVDGAVESLLSQACSG